MNITQLLLRCCFKIVYRVQITGLEHLTKSSNKTLIVSNHTSYLDGLLLYAWFPEKPTFAINHSITQRRLFKPFLRCVNWFPIDHTNPHSLKPITRFIKAGNKAIIFPEGRITTTGSLMKIYEGPGLIAEKSGAQLLAIHIDGPQFSPFSCVQKQARIIRFPKIKIHISEPKSLTMADTVCAHEKRKNASVQLHDLMIHNLYEAYNKNQTLYAALIHSSKKYGGNKKILEDINREPLTYNTLIMRSQALAQLIALETKEKEHVGILLPNSLSMPVVFFALHSIGRIPTLLNFSSGSKFIIRMLATAEVKTVYTARQFIHKAGLETLIQALESQCHIIFLEDLVQKLSIKNKCIAFISSRLKKQLLKKQSKINPESPAVILFTSGSEGTPKGVVLTHKNLLANHAQIASTINFTCTDTVFNCLPTFHSFGLTAGLLCPLFSGSKVFLYPSPLHYRVIPELIYQTHSTILFGTNTFLKGYARHAHGYDFMHLRYIVAGAEKLHEDTIALYNDKFGIRILQGYGVTETSPVISVNSPLFYRTQTVGRCLTQIEYALESIDGIDKGGRLSVKGPNIMQGYLLHSDPGKIQFPKHSRGNGWYDTGDIVSIDQQGYISILGRAKRFAKIGGEMVSLMAVEALAMAIWPNQEHAAVNLPDKRKGEKILLVSNCDNANRKDIQNYVHKHQLGELLIPKAVVLTDKFPILGTGKTDFSAISQIAAEAISQEESEAV